VDLTIEQIERVLADERENCQRKVNQGVLKEDRVQQLMYMGETLDRVLYSVRLAANMQRNLSLRVVRKGGKT